MVLVNAAATPHATSMHDCQVFLESLEVLRFSGFQSRQVRAIKQTQHRTLKSAKHHTNYIYALCWAPGRPPPPAPAAHATHSEEVGLMNKGLSMQHASPMHTCKLRSYNEHF
jgi:hypothetical protein